MWEKCAVGALPYNLNHQELTFSCYGDHPGHTAIKQCKYWRWANQCQCSVQDFDTSAIRKLHFLSSKICLNDAFPFLAGNAPYQNHSEYVRKMCCGCIALQPQPSGTYIFPATKTLIMKNVTSWWLRCQNPARNTDIGSPNLFERIRVSFSSRERTLQNS